MNFQALTLQTGQPAAPDMNAKNRGVQAVRIKPTPTSTPRWKEGHHLKNNN